MKINYSIQIILGKIIFGGKEIRILDLTPAALVAKLVERSLQVRKVKSKT